MDLGITRGGIHETLREQHVSDGNPFGTVEIVKDDSLKTEVSGLEDQGNSGFNIADVVYMDFSRLFAKFFHGCYECYFGSVFLAGHL